MACPTYNARVKDDCAATIERLADGGIKLWVLTGDKQETAINIGYRCSLIIHGDIFHHAIWLAVVLF